MFESLELRKLFAATISDGVLTIRGTSGHESVSFAIFGDEINISQFRNGQDHEQELTGSVSKVRVFLNKGNDALSNYIMPLGTTLKAFGGPGDDRLTGGPQQETLIGGPGDDKLVGGGGDDKLLGKAGKDTLVGNEGDDILKGGLGKDLLWEDDELEI